LSRRLLRKASKNVEPINRRIGAKEIGDRRLASPRPRKKGDRPLSDALVPDMNILPGRGLVDELALQDQRKRLLGAWRLRGKFRGLFITGERIVIIVSVGLIRRAALRMAPDAIFENLVPNVPAAGKRSCRIGADEVGIEYGRV
jgi:hypothetical protein